MHRAAGHARMLSWRAPARRCLQRILESRLHLLWNRAVDDRELAAARPRLIHLVDRFAHGTFEQFKLGHLIVAELEKHRRAAGND